MNVLIACEESQTECKAFRERGHRAFSCDIQPCSGGHPEWHIQGDVLPLLNGRCTFQTMDSHTHTQAGPWDLIIAHPPCTFLSHAGNAYLDQPGRKEKRLEAADFFMAFTKTNCPRVCIENPVGYMNSAFRKPDQTIHPYYFAERGDKENYVLKKTCFWLFGLTPLYYDWPKYRPNPVYLTIRKNGEIKASHHTEAIGNTNDRAKRRSKSFPPIAAAMAEQWGGDYEPPQMKIEGF